MADIEKAVDPVEYDRLHHDDTVPLDDAGYENCANYAVKVLVGVARRDPPAFKAALDAFRADPFSREIEKLMTREEKNILFEGQWGLTGFMWGWAVNTTAYLLEQAPVPNPAIWTLAPNAGAKERSTS